MNELTVFMSLWYNYNNLTYAGGEYMTNKIIISPGKKHRISPYLYMQFMEPLGVFDGSMDAGWDFWNK